METQSQSRVIVNFVVYQIAWLACVILAAKNSVLLACLAAVAAVALHLYQTDRFKSELLLVMLTGLIGTLFDSLLVTLGLIDYPHGTLIPGMAPIWITSLWMAFATTLNVSLLWLQKRLLLAALLGAVAGPLAWLAGQKLNALHLLETKFALLALGLGWAVIMPLLMKLAEGLSRPRDGSMMQSIPDERQSRP